MMETFSREPLKKINLVMVNLRTLMEKFSMKAKSVGDLLMFMMGMLMIRVEPMEMEFSNSLWGL